MSTQKAIVHVAPDRAELSNDVPLPKLPADNWLLVRTKAVALNPTDWKAVVTRNSPGSISGCDFAGVVEEVGKDVTEVKVGDRVAGFVRGADPDDKSNGAFAEHIKVKKGCLAKLSDNMSFEDGATLGVGITTVGQGLFQSLGLPLPPNKVSEPTPVLIYGASTATGTLAVQYAKLVGCEVYATASSRNFDLLRKLGADHVFDYKDADVGAKIREASNDKIKLIFDCIAEKGSFEIGAAAMSSSGGHLSALLAPPKNFPRKDIKTAFTLGYTALGERFSENFPASQTDYDFGTKFWKLSEGLLSEGKIIPHPAEVRKGLGGVIQGMQDMKEGKVSGVKLVWTVE